ncbi:hypothetical protein Ancab_004706 [Ancistrocladus abbreviatus]
MAGLDLPHVLALGFFLVHSQSMASIYEVLNDKHSATALVSAEKEINVGEYISEQALDHLDESKRNVIISNDAMVKNLKKLDMKNLSSEGQLVSSRDPKCRNDEGKSISKKKTSSENPATPNQP